MPQSSKITTHQLTPPWEKHLCSDSLDRMLDQSLQQFEPGVRSRASYEGRMKFDDLALMGPPGRLQGGLHCVGRLFPILRRIAEHRDKETFPCAFHANLGKAIPLFETVTFTAEYHSSEKPGWALTTRFMETDRLNAALWSMSNRTLLSPDAWLDWRRRYEEQRDSPERENLILFGTNYQRTEDLMWCTFGPNSENAHTRAQDRFAVDEGSYGLSFVCYHLDILGALAQRRATEWSPHFTTHVSLALATERLPRDRKLLAIGDRSGLRPSRLSRLRPVHVDGEMRGTTTTGVLLTDESFSTVYSYGWVSVHPISHERMSSLIEKFKAIETGRSG